MANHFDDAERSLVAGLLDPSLQHDHKDLHKRGRLRRCKSTPQSEHVPQQLKTRESKTCSISLIGNLHPSSMKVAAVLSLYLGVGTLCFYLVRFQLEGNKTDGLIDALYFTVVTMTTVGYGDIVPDSVLSKLFACAFVFSGTALVGLILSQGADYLIEKQEALLVRALHLSQNIGPSDVMKEVAMNRIKYKFLMVLCLLLLLITGGTLFLVLVEKMDLVDAFYCVCCTITTLGYGDKSFSTRGGRIFAIFWILTSTICLALFFLYVAELNTESRQRAMINLILTKRVTDVDLEAADIDNDGVVAPAEFVLYKLKEMGKFTQEDVALVLKEFEELDVDQSGTLSVSDIRLAQSPPEEELSK